MKKNIFCFILLMFFAFSSHAEAKYYYSPPDSLVLEDVNPQIKRKIQTRYNTKNDIPQQYKGKLVYNPVLGNNLVNYRKNRIYSSFYVASTIPEIGNFYYFNDEDEAIEVDRKNIEESEYTFMIDVGIYTYDAMALEFEYIMKKTTMIFDGAINDNSGMSASSIDSIRFDSFGYFLNMVFESNYSRFIPVFGFGVGILNFNIDNAYLNGETVANFLKIRPTFAYNYFFGAEIALSSNFLLSIKYKSIMSKELGLYAENKKPNGVKFDFKNSFITLGIKYIW